MILVRCLEPLTNMKLSAIFTNARNYWKGVSMLKKHIKIVENCDKGNFTAEVNILLNKGYKILSTNCCVINSEAYDFCSCFQAILLKEGDNNDNE